MSIWVYKDTHPRPYEEDVTREKCLFCQEELFTMVENVLFGELKGQLKVCTNCGWWCKNRRGSYRRFPDEGRYYSMWGACAQLKTLDLANVNAPVEEIKQ